jgi:hypothetical protein
MDLDARAKVHALPRLLNTLHHVHRVIGQPTGTHRLARMGTKDGAVGLQRACRPQPKRSRARFPGIGESGARARLAFRTTVRCDIGVAIDT